MTPTGTQTALLEFLQILSDLSDQIQEYPPQIRTQLQDICTQAGQYLSHLTGKAGQPQPQEQSKTEPFKQG